MDTWSLCDGRWEQGERAGAEIVWFDLVGSSNGELEALGERFGLHHLAIEDCLSRQFHAPKIDDFGGYLFVVLQAVLSTARGADMEELNVFFGKDFLITYQDRRIPQVLDVATAMEHGMEIRPGSDGLFYELADRVVDAVLPEVNRLAQQLDDLENASVHGQSTATLGQEVLRRRSAAGQVRRSLAQELTVIQRLSRGEYALVAEVNRIYFRDVYDHLVRIDLALENVREDAEVVLNTYLTVINNRLSEIMKVLSVVSALALPAVVIAGIFGTNFDNVPGLHSNWGFVAMLAAMLALGSSMALFFRRRGWF